MEFSKFGSKMTSGAGILSLMDDLGQAREVYGDKMVMMGGGNPGQVIEFQKLMRDRLLEICNDPQAFSDLVASYAPPQGENYFIQGLATLLRLELGWQVGPENICLTNGSQTGFFMLFNLFAGEMKDGQRKKICLPLAPEYIGYADLGLAEGLFVATRPKIELLPGGFFKYRIDFDKLIIDQNIAALCISRPTNPTGNVITDVEMRKLAALAREHDIPLIVDCAYGLPFPGMIYTDAEPIWGDNIIVSLSLSKLGLPAVRTGIIVAEKKVIRALTSMNAIMSLSPNSFGAQLASKLVATGKITAISKELMQPFYSSKMKKAVAAVEQAFVDIPYRIHIPEGAMFLWLWFEDLPITSLELYQLLKEAGALVVSGHYFFPGLAQQWKHRDECIRVTYSQDDDEVVRGIGIIAEVVGRCYGIRNS
jgi:valine--pyruvate aminotransferase